MLGAMAQEKLAIVIAFPNAVMTNNAAPHPMVTADSSVKVSLHDAFVMYGDCQDGVVQQVVERNLNVVFRCEDRGTHRSHPKVYVPNERDPNSHQALIDSSWDESVLIHKFRLDGPSPFQKLMYLEPVPLMLIPCQRRLASLKVVMSKLKWAGSL